jgi:hypothetical protein
MQTSAVRQHYPVSNSETVLRLIHGKNPVKKKKVNRSMLKMLKTFSVHTEEEIKLFHVLFDMLFDGYLNRLQMLYPGLTSTERMIFAYTKLEMPEKVMARNFGYTIDEVKRATFRLCRKAGVSMAELNRAASTF